MLEHRWHGALIRWAAGIIITGQPLVCLQEACCRNGMRMVETWCVQEIQFMCCCVFFLVSESVRDTRSAWRYCKTRATLGRGVAQALQNPNHGLNNSLKLM